MEVFLLEGISSVRAVIEERKRKIYKLFITQKRVAKYPKEYSWLKHKSQEDNFDIIVMEKDDFISHGFSETCGGIGIECSPIQQKSIFDEPLPYNGFYIMLQGVEDPYNLGYALRSLYASGCNGVILPRHAKEFSQIILSRSSAGAGERIPTYYGDDEEIINFFQKNNYKIIAAEIDNSISMCENDFNLPTLAIIGGEKRGISKKILSMCDKNIRIDYGSNTFNASLSAASAATIIGFEALRQHRIINKNGE